MVHWSIGPNSSKSLPHCPKLPTADALLSEWTCLYILWDIVPRERDLWLLALLNIAWPLSCRKNLLTKIHVLLFCIIINICTGEPLPSNPRGTGAWKSGMPMESESGCLLSGWPLGPFDNWYDYSCDSKFAFLCEVNNDKPWKPHNVTVGKEENPSNHALGTCFLFY